MAAGIIGPVVELLGSWSEGTQKRAAESLWQLTARHEAHRAEIASAGAISPLVALLRSPCAGVQAAAAGTLQGLAPGGQLAADEEEGWQRRHAVTCGGYLALACDLAPGGHDRGHGRCRAARAAARQPLRVRAGGCGRRAEEHCGRQRSAQGGGRGRRCGRAARRAAGPRERRRAQAEADAALGRLAAGNGLRYVRFMTAEMKYFNLQM